MDRIEPGYGLVSSVCAARRPPFNYRVLVSGADDFKLVRDGLTKDQAEYLLEGLPPLITKQAAYDLGFVPF
jgi:hypothetical protein